MDTLRLFNTYLQNSIIIKEFIDNYELLTFNETSNVITYNGSRHYSLKNDSDTITVTDVINFLNTNTINFKRINGTLLRIDI